MIEIFRYINARSVLLKMIREGIKISEDIMTF